MIAPYPMSRRARSITLCIISILFSPSVLCASTPPALTTSVPAGYPGSTVTLNVVLSDLGMNDANVPNTIVAVGNDLFLDAASALIKSTSTGAPDCWVNPQINKPDSQFRFKQLNSDFNFSAIRTLVVSRGADMDTSIPLGTTIYSCHILINTNALPKLYTILLSNIGAADEHAANLRAKSVYYGDLIVEDRPATCGSIDRAPTPGFLPFAIPPLLLLLVTRISRMVRASRSPAGFKSSFVALMRSSPPFRVAL